jgi:hypothetical protein
MLPGEKPRNSFGLEGEQDEHRDGERHQPEKLGRGEADVQPALLAVRSRRVADGALEERAEHVADTGRGGPDANRRETGADELCRSEIDI